MKLTAVKIDGKRHLASYSDGKLALLDDFHINASSVADLSREDLARIDEINQFKNYKFSYDSIIDQK